MSTDFFSQASNFQSSTEGSVDPRTGLFNYMMPVAHLIGNNQLGPELTLALAYSPLNSADIGFGIGFSLGLTHYDSDTKMLQLSTGERYKVDETDKAVTLLQYKQDVVRFEKNGAEDAYQVIHKSGQVEILSGPKNAFNLKVPVKILNPLGHSLQLEWDYTAGAVPHLTGIYDLDKKHRALLTVRTIPGVATRLTVWPGMSEMYEIELALHNGRVSTITNLTAGQTLIWSLDYDLHCQFLNRVMAPTGLLEAVTYTQEGHRFPAKGPAAALPYVTRYSQSSGQGDENVRTYTYTKNNFLGSGTGGDWSRNQDYLYGVLSDYQYGSTERWDNGQAVRVISRYYNNYHLLISETVQQNHCIRQHETEYYAQIGKEFAQQPPQFQLPKSATVRFIAGNGQREEVTRTEFDAAGNPTLQIAPDGTRTVWVYYPAKGEVTRLDDDCYGCPADPHGFVRYVKSKTVTPGVASPIGAYDDAPLHEVIYRYDSLPTLPGTTTKAAVVRTHQCLFRVDRHTGQRQLLHTHQTGYVSRPHSRHYGRVDSLAQTVYDGQNAGQGYTQRQVFHYQLDKQHLKQTTHWTSEHDGLTASSVQIHSCFSRKVGFEQDHQGCTSLYEYDAFGRLSKQLNNAGTAYARDIEYAYEIQHEGLLMTTRTDVLGNQSRTWFNGRGQPSKQAILLKGKEKKGCRTVAEIQRDSWGRVTSQTYHDWLPTAGNSAQLEKISVNQQASYDDWGQLSAITDATGKRSLQNYDPVTQISLKTTKAGNLKFGSTKTLYNIRHQPLTVTLLDSQGKPVSRQSHWYDGLGRLRATFNMQNQKTEYTYDAFNRISTIRYSDGTVVKKTYAPFSAGNLVVKIEVGEKVLGEREFDSLGRGISSTVGGRTQTAVYEGSSPVPGTVTDLLGQKVQIQYEPQLGNAPICVEAPNLTQKFTYDTQSGAITQAEVVGQSIQKYTYTSFGQLKKEMVKFDNAGTGAAHRSMAYRYSLRGKLIAYKDVARKWHRLRFDILGRPVEVVDDAVIVTLRYDSAGRADSWTVKDKTIGKQLTTTITFDDFSREIGRQIDSETDVLTLSQTYTVAGQLASRITDSKQAGRLREEYYTYDIARCWLTDYRCSGLECPRDAYGQSLNRQQFTYDRLGNLLTCLTTLADGSQDTARFSYANPADPCQLTKITHNHPAYPATITLTYDKAGRLVMDEANRMLAYDGLGRLASVTQAGSTQTYGYDASSLLILQRRGKADTRELYYQGANRVAEIQRESGTVTRLVHVQGVPTATVTDNSVHLLGTDEPGSVLLSHQQGTESRFRYTPYGQQAAADSDPDLPGYNGERQDPLGGGYHLGNGYRTYNPVLMRFTAPDSLSPFEAGGLNPYAYCLGDPINRTDPSGHMSVGSILGIALGLFGMAAELAAAIPTGGASLTLSGAIIAGIGFLGAATGIASAATEDSDPQASAVLGWISMGLGAASLGSLVLGKMVGGLRQAEAQLQNSFSSGARTAVAAGESEIPRTIEAVTAETTIATETANTTRAAATAETTARSTLESFDRANAAGWVQEVMSNGRTTVQFNFPPHAQMTEIMKQDYDVLRRLGFTYLVEGGGIRLTMDNSVLLDAGGRTVQRFINIESRAVRELYAPFINEINPRAVNTISRFRYEEGVNRLVYNVNRHQGIFIDPRFDDFFLGVSRWNMRWREANLPGMPADLLRLL
ncbi:RHS repeat domain-containing protein (plasmid) [Xenorhabdus stockiae]|uniref:RHS repeat domain-containing protein n=1 Tax=Xenorhabdus stockiae TaxID=351614 RepID=UPI003CF56EB4